MVSHLSTLRIQKVGHETDYLGLSNPQTYYSPASTLSENGQARSETQEVYGIIMETGTVETMSQN
jgi:hypothetical protein